MNKRIWILVFLLAGLLLAGGLYFSLSGGEDEEEVPRSTPRAEAAARTRKNPMKAIVL